MLAWLFVHLPQIGIALACLMVLGAFVGGTNEYYRVSTRWTPPPSRYRPEPMWTEPARDRRH